MARPTRTRMTAGERSAQVLGAAVSAFAETGYAATKTDEIARRAGVSQPYVIRLFGTKQQLFLAALSHVCDRIEQLFRAAAANVEPGEDVLSALGDSYHEFLAERELPLVLLHGFSAGSDPEIGEQVRSRFGRMYGIVRELAGADPLRARRFLATGMLLTVMTAMRVAGEGAIPTPWAEEILDCLEDHHD